MGGLGGPRPPHKRGVGWGGGGDGEARNHHQGQLPLVATGDATGPTITAANSDSGVCPAETMRGGGMGGAGVIGQIKCDD